jgi:hypothetical protein
VNGVNVNVDSRGILRVFGTSAADAISLTQVGTTISVAVGGRGGARSSTALKGITIETSAAMTRSLLQRSDGKNPLLIAARVKGGDDADTITAAAGPTCSKAGRETTRSRAGRATT